MPRILAFADTQLGVSTLDLDDQQDCLERIVEIALEREAEFVLHGGDVFEGPIVTPEHMRVFVDAIAPLRKKGVPIVVIRGNGRHDLALRNVHALDILRELDGIHVCDRPARVSLGKTLAVCTLPWVHPGNLIAAANGRVDHDQINTYVAELLVKIAREMLPDDGRPAVLLAHWAISGSRLPVGLPVEEMREPILPWADLDTIGYDAVIGAHIHQPQQISQPLIDQTLGIVLGSPQQLNHGEHGEHGCWLVDVEPGEAGSAVSTEFIPVDSRRFATVDVTADEDGFHVETPPPTDVNLRVRYHATEELSRRFTIEMLREWVAGQFWPNRLQIEPRIERPERVRAEGISEQISPVDALEAYCEAQGIEEPLRGRMLATIKEWSS